MAQDSSQEKTEDATPRRLREARKKGQVPKSRDVTQVLVLIICFIIFAMSIANMGGEFKRYFQLCFETLAQGEIPGTAIWELGKAGMIVMAKALIPIFAAGMFTAILSGLVQVGAIFSGEPLKPKPERLNPIEGIKNMFKIVVVIELLKNMAKLGLVLYIAYDTLKDSIDAVLMSAKVDLGTSAQITGGIIFEFFIKVLIVFIILSMVDYVLQRWNFMKNMRMTKDEVKREYKQDEGDPAIKGERRRLHREMAFGDVRSAVKKSDVVVTNPIHVACALEYNKNEMAAPVISAKGQRLYAQMMIDIAREEGVPIIRNVPLAWSLIHLEIGDEIPPDLYEAAAEGLTLVYEMKMKEEGNLPPPSGANPPVYV